MAMGNEREMLADTKKAKENMASGKGCLCSRCETQIEQALEAK